MDYSTGGWIGGLIDAANVLLKIADGNTRVVPGAGPLQTKDDPQALTRHAHQSERARQAMLRRGKSSSRRGCRGAHEAEFDAKWGKPDLFLTMTYTGNALTRLTRSVGFSRQAVSLC